jgi:hypothetical protein
MNFKDKSVNKWQTVKEFAALLKLGLSGFA